MRSSVGSEMPRKPGAMSWANAGFSRWPYGVEKGEPNADQWNCATTTAQGSAPIRTPRARFQPACRRKAAIRIADRSEEAQAPEDRCRKNAGSGRFCSKETALAVRRLQRGNVAHQRLVVDVAPLLEDRTGIAESRAAADRPAVLLGQGARRVD